MDLLLSNEYKHIIIVVDRLTKMQHMISLKTLDMIEVANAFIRNVFKLHELPNTIILDCGSQFVLMFWKTLCTHLEIETQLLTTYHPEIND